MFQELYFLKLNFYRRKKGIHFLRKDDLITNKHFFLNEVFLINNIL